MENINQLRAWKKQADNAGLDINDEECNVLLRLLNHALEVDDKISDLKSRVKELEEALSIAMIGGDYLESERRQLNIVLNRGK